MTGPGPGKVIVEASVFLETTKGDRISIPAEVYIHAKGFSRARVTHLDIEHEWLQRLVPPKRGVFAWIWGVRGGIKVYIRGKIPLGESEVDVKALCVMSPLLNKVLAVGERTRTWVGGKFGGIYIGFRKRHIERLERVLREDLKFQF